MKAILAIAVSTMACAAEPAPAGPPVYLALGDSIAFGFDPLVPQQAGVAGYPELIGARRGLPVTNLSCPGEATGGFISPTGNDNHCRENRVAYPLHVAYEGTQLAAALGFLDEHPGTALVTIDLGANDLSRMNDLCAGDVACLVGGFVTAFMQYEQNLGAIFSRLREHYDGPIVALSVYNPFPTETIAVYGLDKLNAALASRVAAYDGLFADGFAAFEAASGGDPCAAGLLIAMPDGSCDVHPSPAGDKLLADAIEAALE